MGKFKLKDFVNNPEAKKLEGISRLDWVSLAKYYEVEINESDRKADIIVKVNDYLICNDMITNEESAKLVGKEKESSSSSENSSESGSEVEGAKAEKKVRKKSSIKEIKNFTEEQLKIHLEIRKLEVAAETETRKLAVEAETRKFAAEAEARKLELESQKLQLDAENKAKE